MAEKKTTKQENPPKPKTKSSQHQWLKTQLFYYPVLHVLMGLSWAVFLLQVTPAGAALAPSARGGWLPRGPLALVVPGGSARAVAWRSFVFLLMASPWGSGSGCVLGGSSSRNRQLP